MKEIPGYKGLYAVTEDGRVWSYPKTWKCGRGRVDRHEGKFLVLYESKLGYTKVGLTDNRHPFVHRLVALAYIPNPMNLPKVNHKDANKKNNHYTNLEWCTQKENVQHAWRLGIAAKPPHGLGAKNTMAILNESEVIEIRALYDFGFSAKEIREAYPIGLGGFYDIVRRKNWTHI